MASLPWAVALCGDIFLVCAQTPCFVHLFKIEIHHPLTSFFARYCISILVPSPPFSETTLPHLLMLDRLQLSCPCLAGTAGKASPSAQPLVILHCLARDPIAQFQSAT